MPGTGSGTGRGGRSLAVNQLRMSPTMQTPTSGRPFAESGRDWGRSATLVWVRRSLGCPRELISRDLIGNNAERHLRLAER